MNCVTINFWYLVHNTTNEFNKFSEGRTAVARRVIRQLEGLICRQRPKPVNSLVGILERSGPGGLSRLRESAGMPGRRNTSDDQPE